MKVLKDGKIDTRKFVCQECGCVFTCRKSECLTIMTVDGFHYVPCCPQCNMKNDVFFDKAEVYEEE